MKNCPVCFSEIRNTAIKCRFCHSYVKPRINEGQFWGTCLMVGGILIGVMSYIRYLYYLLGSDMAISENYSLMFMTIGIILAYLGFLVFGFGTFFSWFISKQAKSMTGEKLKTGKKPCLYCGEIIDVRAVKCPHCLSFMRQEKGKILATFVTVSGILILTTAYILHLAESRSITYMKLGLGIICLGVLMFLFVVLRARYSSKKTEDLALEV